MILLFLYSFGDEDALYDAVFADFLDAPWSHIEAARTADDPMACMESIASAWVEFLSKRSWAARILLLQIADELPVRGIRSAPTIPARRIWSARSPGIQT